MLNHRRATRLFNERAAHLGFAADMRCSYQVNSADMSNLDANARYFKVHTWVFYHTRATKPFKKDDQYLHHHDVRFYCDMQGISDQLNDLKYKGPLYRKHLIQAIADNVSDMLSSVLVFHGSFSPAFFRSGFYDIAITNDYPLICVMLEPCGLRNMRIDVPVFHPEGSQVPASAKKAYTKLQHKAGSSAADGNIVECVSELAVIIKTHFQVPKELELRTFPASMYFSHFEYNVPSDAQYLVVPFADGEPVKLPVRTSVDTATTNITVNIVQLYTNSSRNRFAE